MGKIGFQGISDAKPPQPPKDGPHELRVHSAEHKKSRNSDSTYTQLAIIVEDDDEAQMIFERIFDPAPDLETFVERKKDDSRPEEQAKVENDQVARESYKKHYDFLALRAKRVLHAFDVPYDDEGFDPKDFEGQTATLETRTTKDDQGNTNTEIIYPEVAV